MIYKKTEEENLWHCPFNQVRLGYTKGKEVGYSVHLTVPPLSSSNTNYPHQ
jgi:hypothetical protein